jgi:hypothetical protein
MKTSRSTGVLVLNIEKPYRIAVDGKMVESNIVVCYEPTGLKGEDVAFNLDHCLRAAIFSIVNSERVRNEKVDDEDIQENDFYEKECPTEDEVNLNGISLQFSFTMRNSFIKITDLMNLFVEVVSLGFLKSEHGETITIEVWKTISRKDKEDILFKFCSFFVNPFQKLAQLGKAMEKSSTKNLTTVKE